MENNAPTNMRERLLQKIELQELSMRPKVYFTLRVVALVLLALAVLVVSILILNFILFSLRINSHESLLSFGPRGVLVFLQFFPWWLLLLDVALISLVEWLLRGFRFGYKIPVLYLLLGVIAITTVSALLIDRGTNVNDRLLGRADRHELPFVGEFIEHARQPRPGSGVCVCRITAIAGNTITVADQRTGSTTSLTIVLPENDPRATTTMLEVGDTVVIAGDVDEGVIHAFGVHKIAPVDKVGH
jgi:hypothetical protein